MDFVAGMAHLWPYSRQTSATVMNCEVLCGRIEAMNAHLTDPARETPAPPLGSAGSSGARPHRDEEEHRALVAQGPDVPLPTEDVIEVEGAAAHTRPASPRKRASTLYLFAPDVEPRQVTLDELPTLVGDDRNFVWVDLSDYIRTDLEAVAERLRLHEIGVHSALSSWKRPRLDVFHDHFFVTATTPHLEPDAYRVRAHQIDLFMGRNFLVSAHKWPLPFAGRILTRARQNPALLQHDTAMMLYIVLDELLGYFEQLLEQLQGEIEQMEERALRDTSDTFLEDLLRFKRYAFALSQLAEQHRPVLTAFLRPDFQWVSGQGVEEYYRDLDGRLSWLGDALLAAKDAINGAFDIYVSHVSHRTNNIMKILTIVSTVLLPASVILGFFGTNNIQDMPLLTHATGFVLMVASIVLISAITLLLFHRKGWL